MNRTESQKYQVVVNHEEQYSIWPEGKENAIGWRNAGLSGTKEQCLAYIRDVWTDMRPLSLRHSMMQMENTNMAAKTHAMPARQQYQAWA